MEIDSKSSMTNVVTVDFRRREQKTPSKTFQAGGDLSQKKRALFEAWIRLGTVCVLFDARKEGVKVPVEFKDRGDLRLNFCYDFQVPDFNFNDAGVWATLSFDRGSSFCMVPWETVFGLQSAKLHQGAVWFEDFPTDYDQVNVLGFSEDMVEPCPELEEDEEATISPMAKVVEVDFKAKE